MASATLVASAFVALMAGLVYLYVGVRLYRRPALGDQSRRMSHYFAMWWLALGMNIIGAALIYALASVDLVNVELMVTSAYLQRLLLCVSLIGLMTYLAYLLTGRDLLAPLAAFYSLCFAFLIFQLNVQGPADVVIGTWRVGLTFESPAAWYVPLASLLAIFLPPIVGAFAYFLLFFRVRDRSQRYRIFLVSWALLIWWVLAFAAGRQEALGADTIQLVHRSVSLLAAMIILAAYEPPRWVKRRWDVNRLA